VLGFATDAPPVTRLLIIRHGQSVWNRAGIIQGQRDIELSLLGLQQAEAMANRLRDVRLDAIYSSPLLRARQTAAALAGSHHLPIHIDDDLVEIHHGAWEGLTEADVERQFGDLLQQWRTRPATVQMPGGEHFQDVKARSIAAVERIAAAHPRHTVAVVTHDVVVRAVVAHLLGLPDDYITRFNVSNTGISIVELGDDGPMVVCVNDHGHLDELRRRAPRS
jgi:broad specificity phosphatase PhoE